MANFIEKYSNMISLSKGNFHNVEFDELTQLSEMNDSYADGQGLPAVSDVNTREVPEKPEMTMPEPAATQDDLTKYKNMSTLALLELNQKDPKNWMVRVELKNRGMLNEGKLLQFPKKQKFLDGRLYAEKGLIHKSHFDQLMKHAKVGSHFDFYEKGTGDKKYGILHAIDNDSVSFIHPETKKVQKFKVTNDILNEGQILGSGMSKEALSRDTDESDTEYIQTKKIRKMESKDLQKLYSDDPKNWMARVELRRRGLMEGTPIPGKVSKDMIGEETTARKKSKAINALNRIAADNEGAANNWNDEDKDMAKMYRSDAKNYRKVATHIANDKPRKAAKKIDSMDTSTRENVPSHVFKTILSLHRKKKNDRKAEYPGFWFYQD